MKKLLLLVLCFLLMCSFCITVYAEDNGIYENAGKLYEAWTSQGGVPDYISGVWSTDGGMNNLTFGVVKGAAGEKGQQEILALVKDDSTVTIVNQTYSRNYLYQIQEEIVDAYFDKGLGLMTAGVREYENKLLFEVKASFTDNADTLEMIRQVTEQYGDAVTFSYIDSDIQLVAETQPEVTPPISIMASPPNQTNPSVFIFALCAIGMAFLLFIEIRRRRMLAIAADGTSVVMDAQHISKKEIKIAIRNTEAKPSASLDERVIESIRYCESDNL